MYVLCRHRQNLSKRLCNWSYWDYVTSLKGEQYGTFGAADCLTLMSACENKELGMKLIKYMVGSEVMTAYHKDHYGAPMTADEPYQGDEKLERILTNRINGVLFRQDHAVQTFC